MASPMRAANRKPIPTYMMDSSIERRARIETYGYLTQWMLPRVLGGGSYHTSRGTVSNNSRKAREWRPCGVLAVKVWQSTPASGTNIRLTEPSRRMVRKESGGDFAASPTQLSCRRAAAGGRYGPLRSLMATFFSGARTGATWQGA